jgi:GxxExxY protein
MNTQITTDEKHFPHKEMTYKILGCCMEVHSELGNGFLEAVYQEALAIVFEEKGIPFEKEKAIDILFKGKILNKKYNADFLCFDEIIVELKACESLSPDHISQVLNYLKATRKKIGLLVNFGTPKLQYRRVIL